MIAERRDLPAGKLGKGNQVRGGDLEGGRDKSVSLRAVTAS